MNSEGNDIAGSKAQEYVEEAAYGGASVNHDNCCSRLSVELMMFGSCEPYSRPGSTTGTQ